MEAPGVEVERTKRDVIVLHGLSVLLEAARDRCRLGGYLGEICPESLKELRTVHADSMLSRLRLANEQFGKSRHDRLVSVSPKRITAGE